MNGNMGFTITSKECEQLHEEYVINDCIYYLLKTKELVDGQMSIDEAIEYLKTKTRFSDEVMREYKKNKVTTAMDWLENNKDN